MNEIRQLYDAEVRAQPVERPGMKVVRDAQVTRLEGGFNYVCSWELTADTAPQAVSKQANEFRQRGEELLWRVYDHDQPANLEACLEREGFTPSPQGSLMVLPLTETVPMDPEYDMRRVTSPAALRDYLAVAASAFDCDDGGDFDGHAHFLSHPNYMLFCGYSGEEPAVSGRLEMPSNASFGMLFGGGVVPAHRGKGYYRALVHARARIARERGKKYVVTEARETSRPILEELGFVTLARERIWTLPVNAELDEEKKYR